MASVDTDTRSTSCRICPRSCAVNRDKRVGVCGVENTLRVARAALHEWEEPCISVGPGSGAVFFSGCPLHCVYCQNAAISDGKVGTDISEERLVEIFFNLRDSGAANINLVTATQFRDSIIRCVEKARNAGLTLPIVWNTSGYETVDTINRLAGTVDIYLSDYKYHSPELAQRYSNAPDYPDLALQALRAMVQTAGLPRFSTDDSDSVRLVGGVVVRQLLLPGALEDAKAALSHLWRVFGDSILYSLMNQYTPVKTFRTYPELNLRVSDDDYEAFLDYADDLGISDYYWQQGGAAQESFIPPFDGTGL